VDANATNGATRSRKKEDKEGIGNDNSDDSDVAAEAADRESRSARSKNDSEDDEGDDSDGRSLPVALLNVPELGTVPVRVQAMTTKTVIRANLPKQLSIWTLMTMMMKVRMMPHLASCLPWTSVSPVGMTVRQMSTSMRLKPQMGRNERIEEDSGPERRKSIHLILYVPCMVSWYWTTSSIHHLVFFLSSIWEKKYGNKANHVKKEQEEKALEEAKRIGKAQRLRAAAEGTAPSQRGKGRGGMGRGEAQD
jgi:hypothetical protein